MGEPEGLFRADPFGMSVCSGDPPIDGLSKLEGDEGKTRLNKLEESLIQLHAFFFENTNGRFYAMSFKGIDPFPGDQRIGIGGSHHHPCRFVCDQTFYAGRCLPVMGTGFEVYIDGCTLDGF